MRRTPGGAYAAPIAEINMTPLIDVSLVLVVILLVATPFAFEAALRLQTAGAAAQAAPASAADRVELAAGSSRTALVRCEDGVTHGAFVRLVDRARTAGATRVAVVGG